MELLFALLVTIQHGANTVIPADVFVGAIPCGRPCWNRQQSMQLPPKAGTRKGMPLRHIRLQSPLHNPPLLGEGIKASTQRGEVWRGE